MSSFPLGHLRRPGSKERSSLVGRSFSAMAAIEAIRRGAECRRPTTRGACPSQTQKFSNTESCRRAKSLSSPDAHQRCGRAFQSFFRCPASHLVTVCAAPLDPRATRGPWARRGLDWPKRRRNFDRLIGASPTSGALHTEAAPWRCPRSSKPPRLRRGQSARILRHSLSAPPNGSKHVRRHG